MAGDRTVGSADSTGMGQAQNRDRQVAGAQKMGFFARRKFEKARNTARAEEEGRLQAQATVSAGANVDEKAIVGEHLTTFNKHLLQAIRSGHSRTEDANSADSIIREVVTQDAFINAVVNGAIRTPHEQMDSVRQKEYAGLRQRLGNMLRSARQQKAFMMGQITAHDLDIIYATLLGTPEESTPGAVAMWERDEKWPQDVPRPHQALFIFLENVAVRENSSAKGEFIGYVLKALAVRRTFVNTQEQTMRSLVDGSYINEYLHSASSYPIDRAVETFHSTVVGLVSTPTSEKDSVLGMPGLGYADAFPATRAEKEATILDAQGRLQQSNALIPQAAGAVQAAQTRLAEAERRLKNVQGIVATAEKKGRVTLENGTVIQKGDPRLATELGTHKDAVRTARGELEGANEYLAKARADAARHQADLTWRQRDFETFLATQTPEAVAREMARHFRELLEQYRGNGGTLTAEGGRRGSCFEDVATTMGGRLPNPTITALLERAVEIAQDMTDVKRHFDPNTMEQIALLRGIDAERRQQLATLAEGGNAEAAGILLSQIRTQVTGERDETAVFDYKKAEYDQKLREFGEAIEAAALPEDVKVRFRSVHKCLVSLRYSPEEIGEQLASIDRAFARPLRRGALHAVRRLEEGNFGNLIGISDADKVVARMTFESRSDELPANPGKSEGKWTRFWKTVRFHLFTGESWMSRDDNRPGKLVWLYRKTIAEDVSDLRPRNWFQRRDGTRPDGTTYRRSTPRLLDGIWGLAWKGYIVGGLLAGHALTTPPMESGWDYVKPWRWTRPGTRLTSPGDACATCFLAANPPTMT